MAGRNEREMILFSRDIQRFAVAGAVRTIKWIHTGTVRRFGRSPGTPVATQEAASGGRVALNRQPTFKPPSQKGKTGRSFYPLPGADMVDRATARMQIGDTIFWRNRVEHAGVLEGGRRHSAALNRMVGSDQAPDGFLRLAIEEAKARLRSWKYVPGSRA